MEFSIFSIGYVASMVIGFSILGFSIYRYFEHLYKIKQLLKRLNNNKQVQNKSNFYAQSIKLRASIFITCLSFVILIVSQYYSRQHSLDSAQRALHDIEILQSDTLDELKILKNKAYILKCGMDSDKK